jgi:hypothetical protein
MNATNDLLGISIDVDSVAAHLKGYGIDSPDVERVYRVAIPRVLELFGQLDVRATFFLIAGEAEANKGRVRDIVAAGHEVACHSMTHPQTLDLAHGETALREIVDSKALLESVSGESVHGFRTPGWGVSDLLVRELEAAGYAYDASSYPSWMLYLLRSTVSRKAEGEGGGAPVRLRQVLFDKPLPHSLGTGPGGLVEIPVSTVPVIRVPIYHTFRFLLPTVFYKALAATARLRSGALTYAFHAVDFLDLNIDDVDQRMLRHPGMNWSLKDKLQAAREALTLMGRGRRSVTLRSIAQGVAESSSN